MSQIFGDDLDFGVTIYNIFGLVHNLCLMKWALSHIKLHWGSYCSCIQFLSHLSSEIDYMWNSACYLASVWLRASWCYAPLEICLWYAKCYQKVTGNKGTDIYGIMQGVHRAWILFESDKICWYCVRLITSLLDIFFWSGLGCHVSIMLLAHSLIWCALWMDQVFCSSWTALRYHYS